MKPRNQLSMLALGGFALLSFGCADVDIAYESQESTTQRSQAVVVTPEFRLVGADAIPDHLFLTQMGLLVSEIRLTPLVATSSGLAYSTAEPTSLTFDVSQGQFSQTGTPLTLPSAGMYVVSIRLEPFVADDSEIGSLSVEGFIAEAVDVTNPSETSDGTPLPLPFDERPFDEDQLTDASASPVVWTPFSYNSRRTVFYTLNQVDLSPGNQYLEFSFNLQDWANGAVTHISKAVKNNPSAGSDGGVDVTRQMESLGHGLDAIVQTGAVRRDEAPALR